MPLLQPYQGEPIKLRLARDLVRSLKRGHPWVFADALRLRPPAAPGSHAILLDNHKGREVAWGFYDAASPLTFRACVVEPDEPLNEAWARRRFERALALRHTLFLNEATTGFRLFNGEGDGLPGLICDVYGDTAVLQFDGPGPKGFWSAPGVAEWVAQALSLRCVYERGQARAGQGGAGQVVWGQPPAVSTLFVEHGVQFTTDIMRGQKTGFFLDQRENRRLIGPLAAGRRVLNLFGYTGGFSVYAGLGGATHVTTVDIAGPALAAADEHWRLNALPPTDHELAQADAFAFLEEAAKTGRTWGLVIADPPSFAPTAEAVPKALAAYHKLIATAATVTTTDGFLAAASCSSHITLEPFLETCEEGVSRARRRATVLGVYGLPPDHPAPLPLAEFRYLKFALMRVE
jgi:23S rRNA (cytosine1962-C5)-methyltransferase